MDPGFRRDDGANVLAISSAMTTAETEVDDLAQPVPYPSPSRARSLASGAHAFFCAPVQRIERCANLLLQNRDVLRGHCGWNPDRLAHRQGNPAERLNHLATVPAAGYDRLPVACRRHGHDDIAKLRREIQDAALDDMRGSERTIHRDCSRTMTLESFADETERPGAASVRQEDAVVAEP